MIPPRRLKAKRYLNSSLPGIDEVGFRPLDRQEANLFFRLVSARYEKGSIIRVNGGRKLHTRRLRGRSGRPARVSSSHSRLTVSDQPGIFWISSSASTAPAASSAGLLIT